ncbi:hypothetical protein ABHI18_009706 [Aspergillus niger]
MGSGVSPAGFQIATGASPAKELLLSYLLDTRLWKHVKQLPERGPSKQQ